jgi:hypothetical protein
MCYIVFHRYVSASLIVSSSFGPDIVPGIDLKTIDHEELWQPAWGVRTGELSPCYL